MNLQPLIHAQLSKISPINSLDKIYYAFIFLWAKLGMPHYRIISNLLKQPIKCFFDLLETAHVDSHQNPLLILKRNIHISIHNFAKHILKLIRHHQFVSLHNLKHRKHS
jgi:hypothetical protein